VTICKEKYSAKEISFTDDNFVLDKERVYEICGFIRKLNIKWSCLARADMISKELLRIMKDSGCTGLTMGVETGDEKLRLGVLKKRLSDKDILKAKQLCHEIGITVNFFFMCGFPNETMKEIGKTISFARKTKTVFFAYNMTVCYPGTEIWGIAVKEGKYPVDYWNKVAKGEIEKLPLYYPDGFTRDEFLEMSERYIYKYYFDLRYIPIALSFILKSRENFLTLFVCFFEFIRHLSRKFILRKSPSLA
jgi:magnesium-protoporphyrin IX monomethyl ester (oxidative) cyclase